MSPWIIPYDHPSCWWEIVHCSKLLIITVNACVPLPQRSREVCRNIPVHDHALERRVLNRNILKVTVHHAPVVTIPILTIVLPRLWSIRCYFPWLRPWGNTTIRPRRVGLQ